MTALINASVLHPETLLEGAPQEGNDRTWWVLYTRSRQEKALARDLFGRDIAFYLPLVKRTTVYRRNRVSSYLPVFSNYLFMYGSEDDRVWGLTTNRVSRVLDVNEPERLRSDLGRLYRLIASGEPLTVESRLVPGQRIRIRRGPLEGLEGTILRRRGETRLLVSVDFLQQGASVVIEDYMTEPVD